MLYFWIFNLLMLLPHQDTQGYTVVCVMDTSCMWPRMKRNTDARLVFFPPFCTLKKKFYLFAENKGIPCRETTNIYNRGSLTIESDKVADQECFVLTLLNCFSFACSLRKASLQLNSDISYCALLTSPWTHELHNLITTWKFQLQHQTPSREQNSEKRTIA